MEHFEQSGLPSLPQMASSPGLDPSSEIYKMLLKERIVFLGTEVTDRPPTC